LRERGAAAMCDDDRNKEKEQYLFDKTNEVHDKDRDAKKDTPQKFGADGLPKIKDIAHVIKKKIPHGKKPGSDDKPNKIMSLAWGPNDDDTRMAVVDQLGLCAVWDTNKQIRMYGLTYAFAQSVAVNHDTANPLVLVGGMRNATTLYKKNGNAAVMLEQKTWIQHDGYISSLHFLPKDECYISASGDAEIRIINISRAIGDPAVQIFRGHAKDAQSIKFPRDDPSKTTFITCSSDKSCRMWDTRTGGCVLTYKTQSELNACSIFPNGNMIAAGGEKDKTYVYDVRAGREVSKYARNNMKTASCEFSMSGRELFIGHEDGAIIVWDIFGSGENKQYSMKIEAHTKKDDKGKPDIAQSRVQVLDVGPHGFLASGGFDGQVNIWGAPLDA